MRTRLDCLAQNGDYKRAYDDLLTIYNGSALQSDALAVLTEAFYKPNEKDIENLVDRFTALDSFVRRDWETLNRMVQVRWSADTLEIGPDTPREKREELLREQLAQYREVRIMLGKLMRLPLRFVNKSGKPLSYLPLLKLDSALLEQPLYR